MPKGIYSRDGNFQGVWTSDQDEWLKARCQTNMSYRAIAVEFNKAFPGSAKTRSAVLGRAARKGYTANKPHAANDKRVRKGKTDVAKPREVKNEERKQRDRRIELRDEGRIHAVPMSRPRGAQAIAEARKGHVPAIVESRPVSSVLLSNARRGSCKWPTCDDVREFQVCGADAVIGAYCEHHAKMAYREMPTMRRNKIVLEQNRKRIQDEDAQWIADHVLDDVIEGPTTLSPEVEAMVTELIGKVD